jgi:hypothetical protein
VTVESLRRRRPETLGQLLEAYGRELQSVAYLILRDRAEAEDAVIHRQALRQRVRFSRGRASRHAMGRTARLRFPKGRHQPTSTWSSKVTLASAWHIVVSTRSDEPAFLAPALRMWATDNPDGAGAASEAFAHCVATDQVADECGPSWPTLEDRLNVLVPTGTNVTLAVQDGWRIDQARVVAVASKDIRSGANGPEYSVAFVDTAGLEQTMSIELDPGEWIAQVALNASKDGVRFGAVYYLRLFVTG